MLADLLSLFVTFGLDETIDGICRDHLGIMEPTKPSALGLPGYVFVKPAIEFPLTLQKWASGFGLRFGC